MKEKTLYWLPRVLTILAILFVLMFSMDVFSEKGPIGRKLVGFLVHNIPVLILTGVLVVAWIWEFVGGILFIVAGIAAGVFFKSFTSNPASLIVLMPFVVTGGLFILHHLMYRRRQS